MGADDSYQISYTAVVTAVRTSCSDIKEANCVYLQNALNDIVAYLKFYRYRVGLREPRRSSFRISNYQIEIHGKNKQPKSGHDIASFDGS
jgi:hypothetical protein